MSSSSSLNYEGWATAASLITVSDCPSVGVSQMAISACARYEEEGHFSLVSRTPFLHENNESARSDWLEKKETFHDLASQNRCNARDGWGCTDGALYVAYSILAKKTPDSLTCWLVVSHIKSIFSIICPSAFLWINYLGGVGRWQRGLNWLFVCQQSTQRCDVCVKWELVWVGLPGFVHCFGFCSSSNELWKPWLQLECLIATEKREGALVNTEKARGAHVPLSKGQNCPDHHEDIFFSSWGRTKVMYIVGVKAKTPAATKYRDEVI